VPRQAQTFSIFKHRIMSSTVGPETVSVASHQSTEYGRQTAHFSIGQPIQNQQDGRPSPGRTVLANPAFEMEVKPQPEGLGDLLCLLQLEWYPSALILVGRS